MKQFLGYDTAETFYADVDLLSAGTVTGDTIIEQTEYERDAAGNVILTTRRRRLHDATGTGELTSPSGSQPKARVTYVAAYPDALGRTQAVADYGTNGDSALTRPSTIPGPSDTVLVSRSYFNDDGEAYKSVDPKGKDDRSYFDHADGAALVVRRVANVPVSVTLPRAAVRGPVPLKGGVRLSAGERR